MQHVTQSGRVSWSNCVTGPGNSGVYCSNVCICDRLLGSCALFTNINTSWAKICTSGRLPWRSQLSEVSTCNVFIFKHNNNQLYGLKSVPQIVCPGDCLFQLSELSNVFIFTLNNNQLYV